jgi:Ca-activated chloride channel family protein
VAVKLNPGFYNAWQTKSLIHSRLGEQEQEAECYLAMARMNPKNQGILLGKLGRYKEAIAAYDEALALDQNDKRALDGKKNADKLSKKGKWPWS